MRLILIILLLNVGQSYAQHFYISPAIENAHYFTTYKNNYIFNTSSNYFIEKQNITQGDINMGISLGYTFNQNISLETGLYQDASVAGYNLYFKAPKNYIYGNVNETLYENIKLSASAGIVSNRIPLILRINIYKNKNSKNINVSNLKLNFGTSFLFKNKGKGKPLTGNGGVYQLENTVLTEETVLLAYERQYGIGFNFEIDCFVNWNNTNLFDVSLGFQYSKTQFTNLPVKITENGKTSVYRFSGTPTSIKIQISRDINLKRKSS